MAESFSCPSCGTKYGWKAELAGKRVRCKKCSGQFVVPAQTPAPPPPAADLGDLFAEDAAAQANPTDLFDEDSAWVPPAFRADLRDEYRGWKPGGPRWQPWRALTIDSSMVASNPGRLKIQWRKYLASFPDMPVVYGVGIAIAVFFAAISLGPGKQGEAFAPVAGVVAVLCVVLFDVIRAREHFLHGCVCPAVIISVRPYLLAVASDLSTGGGYYPAIKIVAQPLRRMTGGPPKVGMRVATVALYEGKASEPHWRDFLPLAVNCVTTDMAAIERVLASIPQEEWDMLENALPWLREPYRKGTLRMLRTG